MFKVANDAALFFYRTVIKTIDTADTALLAHIEVLQNKKELMAIAFKKLITKIAALCFPLLGVVLLIFMQGVKEWNDLFVFQAFIIMALGYLIETMFMPYERILEIKREYVYLTISYIPYVVMITFLLAKPVIASIGLVPVIGMIHGVRLVSLICMVYGARARYGMRFPVLFVIRIAGLSAVGLCVGYIVLSYLLPHVPVYPFYPFI